MEPKFIEVNLESWNAICQERDAANGRVAKLKVVAKAAEELIEAIEDRVDISACDIVTETIALSSALAATEPGVHSQ